jgi:hypothetical protein
MLIEGISLRFGFLHRSYHHRPHLLLPHFHQHQHQQHQHQQSRLIFLLMLIWCSTFCDGTILFEDGLFWKKKKKGEQDILLSMKTLPPRLYFLPRLLTISDFTEYRVI